MDIHVPVPVTSGKTVWSCPSAADEDEQLGGISTDK